MQASEIKAAIDKDMADIQTILMKDFFVLNREIVALNEHIVELQKMCGHEFDEYGVCKFCYTKKPL